MLGLLFHEKLSYWLSSLLLYSPLLTLTKHLRIVLRLHVAYLFPVQTLGLEDSVAGTHPGFVLFVFWVNE